MKIKKGDKVLIIQGNDAGKSGSVLRVMPKEKSVVVENLNLSIRHIRPRRSGEKGQKVKIPRPLDFSKVKLICPKCKKATRIGYQLSEKKKQRLCKKCNALID